MKKSVKIKKMNEKYKMLWVDALRSGKYQQGKNGLHQLIDYSDRSGGYYCCLGVLCDVAKIKGEINLALGSIIYDGKTGYLSEALLEKFGITEQTQHKLAGFNDNKNWSFKKIAAYIERYM